MNPKDQAGKNTPSAEQGWRYRLEVIIFGTSTTAGRNFDIALLFFILSSVAVVVIDSVPRLHAEYEAVLWRCEIFFTAIFTAEYLTRVWCTQQRRAYLISFWGVIDLLAILPTYIAILAPEAAPLAEPAILPAWPVAPEARWRAELAAEVATLPTVEAVSRTVPVTASVPTN